MLKTSKLFWVGMTFLLTGCQTMSNIDRGLAKTADSVAARDRVTGERTINIKSRAKQIEESDRRTEEMLKQGDAKGLKRDAAIDPVGYARLERVVQRIHAVSHMRHEKWKVVLLPGNEWNAFVAGGTYIMVFKALLDDLKNDDQLAAVLGHEIAHVAANHAYEQQANQSVQTLSKNRKASAEGFKAAFTLDNEREADRIGILYMALAGFDPDQAIALWDHVYRTQGDNRFGYVDHPVPSERADEVRTVAAKVKRYYRAGQQNPEYESLLKNNVLWQSTKKTAAAGEGGGFIATLEAVANTYTRNMEAKTEQLKQQRVQRELDMARAGIKVLKLGPSGPHDVTALIQYQGQNIFAKEVSFLLVLDFGTEKRNMAVRRPGNLYAGSTHTVVFHDETFDALGPRPTAVNFTVDNIIH